MSPSYRWKCFSCNAINPAGINTCSVCGFPASASALQIELSAPKRDGTRKTLPVERESADIHETISKLPFGKQVAAVTLLVIAAAGFFSFRFLDSWLFALAGIVVAALAIVPLGLIVDSADSKKQNEN